MRWRRGDDPKMNAGLILELTAECTRDPEIARVVRDKDRIVGDRLAQAVQRIAQARGVMLTRRRSARARAMLLQCLVEGLACRVVRDPKLRRANCSRCCKDDRRAAGLTCADRPPSCTRAAIHRCPFTD